MRSKIWCTYILYTPILYILTYYIVNILMCQVDLRGLFVQQRFILGIIIIITINYYHYY